MLSPAHATIALIGGAILHTDWRVYDQNIKRPSHDRLILFQPLQEFKPTTLIPRTDLLPFLAFRSPHLLNPE